MAIPLTARQKKALSLSAKHWLRNLQAGMYWADISAEACACCREWNEFNCIGCPVFNLVGEISCKSTPYVDAIKSMISNDRDAFDEHSFREYMFLLALADGNEDWARFWCETKNTSNE